MDADADNVVASLKPAGHFRQTYLGMMSDDRHADVYLYCDNGSVIRCHQFVMGSSSDLLAGVFRALRDPCCSALGSCQSNDPAFISLPGVDAGLLERMVKLLYTGQVSVDSAKMNEELCALGKSLGFSFQSTSSDPNVPKLQRSSPDDPATSVEERPLRLGDYDSEDYSSSEVDFDSVYSGDSVEEPKTKKEKKKKKKKKKTSSSEAQAEKKKKKKKQTPKKKRGEKRVLSGESSKTGVVCPTCQTFCISGSVYREHLSTKHYKALLEKSFLSSDLTCGICGYGGNCVVRHVGSVHRLVDDFLTPTERKALPAKV